MRRLPLTLWQNLVPGHTFQAQRLRQSRVVAGNPPLTLSSPLPGPVQFPLLLPVFDGFPFVVLLFAPGQGDLHLGMFVPEVHPHRESG